MVLKSASNLVRRFLADGSARMKLTVASGKNKVNVDGTLEKATVTYAWMIPVLRLELGPNECTEVKGGELKNLNRRYPPSARGAWMYARCRAWY